MNNPATSEVDPIAAEQSRLCLSFKTTSKEGVTIQRHTEGPNNYHQSTTPERQERIVLPRQKDKRSSFPRGGHGLHYDDSLAFVAGGYRLVIGIGRIGLASLGRLLFGGSNTPAIAGRIGSAGVQTGGRAEVDPSRCPLFKLLLSASEF